MTADLAATKARALAAHIAAHITLARTHMGHRTTARAAAVLLPRLGELCAIAGLSPRDLVEAELA